MNNTATIENQEARSGSLERFVRRLFEARLSAAASKKVMKEAAEKLGSCEGIGDNEDRGTRCYQSRLPKEKWCDICKTKLPLWEDYQHKSNMAGAALRVILKHAQTLPPNVAGEPQPPKT
jgi:hypothetical protein